MSFEDKMKPKLNPKGDQENDWYIHATTDAMNEYMEELEKTLSKMCLEVFGSALFIVPGTPPYPMTIPVDQNDRAAFIPSKLRFNFDEVKTAMWCNSVELSFINLFVLFGTKLSLNFMALKTSPFIASVTAPPVWVTAHWAGLGAALITYAKSLGDKCTPELFLKKQSELMYQGIQATLTAPCASSGTVPPGGITAIASGPPASVPPQVVPLPGVFTGFVRASFERVDS